MSEIQISDEVAQLAEKFDDLGAEIDEVEAQQNFERLHKESKLPAEEAIKGVRRHYLDKNGLTEEELYTSGDNDFVTMEELEAGVDELVGTEDDFWCSIRAEIVSLSDEEDLHPAVETQGYLGNDGGRAKFTIFTNSPFSHDFEVGDTVEIRNVAASVYQGTYEVSLNSNTKVEEIDMDFDVPEYDPGSQNSDVEINGIVTNIKTNEYGSDSGLIQRCGEEDCTHVLRNGRCREHGNVDDFEWDLRVKANVSDGEDTYSVILGTEETEDILGIDEVQDAVDMVDMDTSVITDMVIEALHGETVELEATHYQNHNRPDNYMVNEMELSPDVADDALDAAREGMAEILG